MRVSAWVRSGSPFGNSKARIPSSETRKPSPRCFQQPVILENSHHGFRCPTGGARVAESLGNGLRRRGLIAFVSVDYGRLVQPKPKTGAPKWSADSGLSYSARYVGDENGRKSGNPGDGILFAQRNASSYNEVMKRTVPRHSLIRCSTNRIPKEASWLSFPLSLDATPKEKR